MIGWIVIILMFGLVFFVLNAVFPALMHGVGVFIDIAIIGLIIFWIVKLFRKMGFKAMSLLLRIIVAIAIFLLVLSAPAILTRLLVTI